jgi:hypothetical protein
MKELKDYLHLYIGCPCVIGDMKWKRDENTHGLAPGIDLDYGKPIRTTVSYHVLNAYLHQTTLILRPLDSMIEQEAKDLGILNLWIGANVTGRITWGTVRFPTRSWPKALNYGFDLFGLRAAGLAIYESDLEDPRDYKELDEPEPLNP